VNPHGGAGLDAKDVMEAIGAFGKGLMTEEKFRQVRG
jgi:hypothetical protein